VYYSLEGLFEELWLCNAQPTPWAVGCSHKQGCSHAMTGRDFGKG